MSIQSLGRSGRLALMSVAVATTLAVPAVALADTTPGGGGGATMAIDSVTVIGKVVAVAHVSVVCEPFDSIDWDTGGTYQTTEGSIEFGSLSLLQAQGRRLDSSSAEFGGLVTCDGSTVNELDVAIDASSSPWKNGTAVASVRIFIADAASFNDSDAASAGPTTVRLTLH